IERRVTEKKLENQHIFKPRAHSEKAFVIEGGMVSFFENINRTSLFISKGEAVADAQMLLNQTEGEILGRVHMGGEKVKSLRDTLKKYQGLDMPEEGNLAKAARQFQKIIHTGTLGLKLQIMGYQTASLFTAAADMNLGHLLFKGHSVEDIHYSGKTMREIEKHSAILHSRMKGGAHQIITPSASSSGFREFYGMKGTMAERISNASLSGIKWGDSRVVIRVWKAAKLEMKGKK
ncbi:uncharacterized protein METZ01_LOCUS502244, partial [marine metagenome]